MTHELPTDTDPQEEALKEAFFRKHYFPGNESATLTPKHIAALQEVWQEEVFPNYTTYVERGRHKRLEQEYGRYFLLMSQQTGRMENYLVELVRIIQSGALHSYEERLAKGIVAADGWSPEIDKSSGGSDSVFLRIVTKSEGENPRRDLGTEEVVPIDRAIFYFRSALLDRLDWYGHDTDKYGSRHILPTAPEELFRLESEDMLPTGNELCFPHGVSIQDLLYIAVENPKHRELLIKKFHHSGITEISGKPVEEVVVAKSQMPEKYKELQPRESPIGSTTHKPPSFKW